MPSLLKEIRDAAVDANVPIANVLRKCAVLGAKLKNNELRDWALQELNGYKDENDLPEYRKVMAPLTGDFAGPFQSGYKNAPIPAMLLPEKMQDRARTARFPAGVASLESLLEGAGKHVTLEWPGDWILWAQLDGKFEMTLIAARQVIGGSAIVDMIDTVRNRILEFCLRLEEEMPELMADDDPSPTAAVEVAASNVFNQVFVFGPYTGNIANASPAAEQTALDVNKGDLSGLTKALREVGVPADQVDALKSAIEDVGENGQKVGPIATDWFKRAKQAVASDTWSLAKGVTINTISHAVQSFLGLGSS